MEDLNRPESIYIHVTGQCNLRCGYCYFPADYGQTDELSYGRMCEVLQDSIRLKASRIVFTGGEPLIRADIIDLASFFKSRSSGSGIGLCIATNGTLIDSTKASQLVDNFDEIRISVDGFEKIHDSLRGEGSFKKVMRAFHFVLAAGGNPVAFITASAANINGLKDFMAFLLQEGISRIHVSPVHLTGRAIGKTELVCNKEDIEKSVTDFWFDAYGIKLDKKNRTSMNCGAGKYITVYPDGSVYPCHLLAFREYHLGNVQEEGLHTIFRSSVRLNKLRSLNLCKTGLLDDHLREIIKDGPYACLGQLAHNTRFREKLKGLIC